MLLLGSAKTDRVADLSLLCAIDWRQPVPRWYGYCNCRCSTRKVKAVTGESGEVAACSLAQEGRQRQSLGPGVKTPKLLLSTKQKQQPSAGLLRISVPFEFSDFRA